MKNIATIMATIAMMTALTGSSFAACPPKIEKNGATAPLETPANAPGVQTTNNDAGTTSTFTAPGQTAGKVSKDGSTMPLAGDKTIASSAQDASAQQKGGQTAAEGATSETACN